MASLRQQMRRPSTRGLRAVLVATTMLLAACPKQTAVWIVAASTADRLQFGLGKRLGREQAGYVSILIVQRCGNVGDANLRVWALLPATGGSGPGLPGRVTFGTAVAGFLQDSSTSTLSAGSYLAATEGTGRAYFLVDSAGSIKEAPHCPAPTSPR